MVNPRTIKMGKPHTSWRTAGFSRQACREAISKVRLLTDAMLLGEKLNKMFGQGPKCQCTYPVENRFHVLLDCPLYEYIRELCISRKVHLLTQHPKIKEIHVRQRKPLLYLLLDPTWFPKDIGCMGHGIPNILSEVDADILEGYSRKFCYQLYRRRWQILEENESGSETEDEDVFSLHDTTEDSSTIEDSSDSDA